MLKTLPNIVVLYGGDTLEREISLLSGTNVAELCRTAGYSVRLIDPKFEPDFIESLTSDDVVLLMLHGAFGEDGQVQRLLDEAGVTYVGSGPIACEQSFDKIMCKGLLASVGFDVPRGHVIDAKSFVGDSLTTEPYVLKPVRGGSSIGMYIARKADEADAKKALNALDTSDQMMIEELIEGIEVTVGIVGDEVLPLILIQPPDGKEFDYENKYNGATNEIANPEDISPELQQKVQKIALQVHDAIGARHLSRTDMIIDAQERVFILDVNTSPGMTKESLVPKAAAAAGISGPELMKKLISLV